MYETESKTTRESRLEKIEELYKEIDNIDKAYSELINKRRKLSEQLRRLIYGK